MSYYADLTRKEELALAIKNVDRQAEMLRELDRRAKARYDERKAKLAKGAA